MAIGTLTLILFGLLILVLLSGLPLTFSLSGVALIFIFWRMGPDSLYLFASTTLSSWTNFIMIAIPLFILMANLLGISGIAEDLYESMFLWMGGVRGGLAIGTVIICAIFAAMAGISGVGTVTMGMIALPSMLKRGYDKYLAIGCISAGGTLGIVIPPSVVMIMYGSLVEVSVGKLFMAGVLSGIAVMTIFILYILVRCFLQPSLGPALPKSERVSWRGKFASLKSIVAPLMLIILVLGVIYSGICTPTEASGLGAFGALIVVIIRRRFKWDVFMKACEKSARITCMIMWIMVGAKLFSRVYFAIGAPDLITNAVSGLEVNRWLIIFILQIILLILGCFIDPMGILVITTPVFVPIVSALGFDLIWFGVLFTINMEVGYITPPFGFNLFYMKGIVPREISMFDIYRANVVWSFLGIVGIATIMIFPELALWLPRRMG